MTSTERRIKAMADEYCASELESAKAAFRELVTIVYEREAAYRAVIDGMTQWLEARAAEDTRINYMGDSETADAAIIELDRLKTSALSGLRSLPPPDLDSPSTSPAAPQA